MQTGQNSIAPENSLPQLGQVRWGSVLIGLTVLRMRSKHRKGHGFPHRFLPVLTGRRDLVSDKIDLRRAEIVAQNYRRVIQ
jgi:hypothetical protein